MSHLLWCEARCVGLYDESYDDMKHPCSETSPGEFGVRAATQAARIMGWTTAEDGWLCPKCTARRKNERKKA